MKMVEVVDSRGCKVVVVESERYIAPPPYAGTQWFNSVSLELGDLI
jgi:hypothetical protein